MIRFLNSQARRATLVLVITAMLSACATGPSAPRPVPEADFSAQLPDVAAQYLSILKTKDPDHAQGETLRNEWRFWREDNLVIRDNLDTHISDLWRRDGTTLSQKKLFHDDQRGVEFQPDDLRMLNIEPQWQALTLLFDIALLEKLHKVDSGWRDDVPFQRYEGHVDNADWTIELRTDLMLPLLIDYQSPGQHETFRLISAYPLVESPWIASTGTDYNIIDFADLGDMGYDPFVKKVEILLGGVHQH